MPIPQLSRRTKSPRDWRGKKKKYYLGHSKYKYGRKRGKRDPNLLKKLINKAVFLFIIIVILGSIIGLASVAWLSRNLPDPNRLLDRQVAQSTKIYDRAGETVLYEIHGAQQRTLVTLEQIPEHLKNATIAIEDKNFYKHKGISIWGIVRGVVWQTIRGKRAQGGSTLTQQFIKNAVLTSERKISRKIKEWILAYKVENKYSKDEILQMYLNEIPYGSTAYGVEAASQLYFDKSVSEITVAEAAILAALPQAPTRYSPYGANKDLLFARQQYILDLMVEQGYLSQEEANNAKDEELKFKEQTANITAPHFVFYVKELLAEKYGEKTVEQGGLKIITTLDLYKQKIAQEVIDQIGPKNEEEYQATNASLVSIDPKTGQILAMVGSRDYFNDEIDGQVNIALRPRQPGSSFKPIVYTAAFQKGYTPNTILYDVVTNFSHDPAEPYEPHNYDNQEHGPVTMRKALAGSLNVPAVKTIYLAGIDNVLNLGETLGYSTFSDRSRFGLSLVLGGGEVKLLEHANAYGAFAREGILHPPISILKVEDKDGEVLEEFDKEEIEEKEVLDKKIVRLTNNILSDNQARAFAFGVANWLTLGPRPVAAKTGTTNDYRDAWTIGYTPSLVTGVWVGNNDNSEMERGAAGGTVAAPIWHDYMKRVLGDTPVEQFNTPQDIITGKAVLDGKIGGKHIVKIDKSSGLLATEHTPEHLIEEKLFSQHHSILYYINKDDPRGAKPDNPTADPQFELWEERVLAWAEKEGEENSQDQPPEQYDNLHKPEFKPVFSIVNPSNNQIITEAQLTASIKATAPRGINRAEYYVDGNMIDLNQSYPFNLDTDIGFLANGFHELMVKVCDDVDNCSSKSFNFNLKRDGAPSKEEVSCSWSSTSSGLAINNVDFPLSLGAQVTNPSQTAKIKFYAKAKDSEAMHVATAQPVNSQQASAKWHRVPASGTYSLYAECFGWNNQFAKSNEIVITVTNINDQLLLVEEKQEESDDEKEDD